MKFKNNILDGEFTEIEEKKEINFWLKSLPNWVTIPTFLLCLGFVIQFQFKTFQPYITENEILRNDNWEMKNLVMSCKCKECKITLKTIRGLYVYNHIDSLLFEMN